MREREWVKGIRAGVGTLVALVALVLLMTACDSGSETGHDAGVAKGRDDTPKHVYNMPKGVPNVTAFCSFGNLIYEGSRSGSGAGFITVVPNAPQCKGVADGGTPHA